MDHNSPRSRRSRKPEPKPDLYSTFVVHSDSDSDQGRDRDKRKAKPEEDENVDLYATMVYKGESDGGGEEDDEEDDSLLPPLLKRLPKDFGGGASLDYDEDDGDESGDFGTMIVKTDRSSHSKKSPYSSKPRMTVSPRRRPRGVDEESSDEDDEEDDDDDGEFGTFVVKSSSKKGKEKEIDMSTMGRAVASMQKSNFGGKTRKLDPSSPSSQLQGEDHRKMQQQNSIMSTTSLPDSITREDPTTKYEFLNELGKLLPP